VVDCAVDAIGNGRVEARPTMWANHMIGRVVPRRFTLERSQPLPPSPAHLWRSRLPPGGDTSRPSEEGPLGVHPLLVIETRRSHYVSGGRSQDVKRR
jgi:hypothetical protein